MIPVRKFDGDKDTKLIAFCNVSLYIGIISKPILSKIAIIAAEPAHVKLHKVIINENVNRLNEIQSIIGTEDITSVDVYSDEINEGKFVVTGLRSIIQSEKLINMEEKCVNTDVEIKATRRIVKNNEEYDLQANVGLLGTYNLSNNISNNQYISQDKLRKSLKMSRHSVEELIKTYALTQFKEFEASDELPTASGTVLKQSVKLVNFDNIRDIDRKDVYFEQLEVLNTVIKDLY